MFLKSKNISTEGITSFHEHQSSKVILESTQGCFERGRWNQEIKEFPEMTK